MAGSASRAKRKKRPKKKKKDYYVSERHYGSFQRYFALPDGVDADKIAATFKNGVLTVALPKTAEAQKSAKKIEVKAA
jgi:HSP20 family protein